MLRNIVYRIYNVLFTQLQGFAVSNKIKVTNICFEL